MSSRRGFLAGWAGLALSLGQPAARAQPTRRVGIVADAAHVRNIEEGLQALGWRAGENLIVVSEGTTRLDRAQAIIEKFVRLPVDVLVVFTDAAASVAVRASRTIPIVLLTTGSVVDDGLVASLARPDRNLTGLSFDAPREITGKRLALLKAMAPKVECVGFLIESIGPRGEHEARATSPETRAAVASLGIRLVPLLFESSPGELERALREAVAAGADGLLVSEGVLVTHAEHQRRIHEIAARHRIAVLHSVLSGAQNGGLMAYGLNFDAFVRRLPYFIDRILRGAKPGDLPIEQPSRLELVVNERAARTLGLRIPASLRLQADRVIA